MNIFRTFFRYRAYIKSAVLNDYKTRYARSRFGLLWVVLHPLAQVVMFATVLSTVLAARLPGLDNKFAYTIYLLAGMLCWNLFSEVVTKSMTLFMDNASMLKKINFPRMILPAIPVGSALVANIALAIATLLLIVALGYPVYSTWAWVPFLVILTLAFATGLGLVVGVLNVFSRDFGQVFSIVLQFWFWLTPIVYPKNILPQGVAMLSNLNPMTVLVDAYHSAIVYGKSPDGYGMAWIFFLGAGSLVLGWVLFRRASPEMVDEL